MAGFYKGFAFEYDVVPSSRLLMVKGIPIQYVRLDDRRFCAKPQGRIVPVTAPSLEKLARAYIDGSTRLRRRDAEKRRHLAKLAEGRVKWNGWRRD